MADQNEPTGLERRERRGSEKRAIGAAKQRQMLPKIPFKQDPEQFADNVFNIDSILTSYEDSYCDTWSRMDVIDSRTRSLFVVAMMSCVGNVGNQFELGWHAPAAIYNGATIDELEAIITNARMLAGGPVAGWAQQTIRAALTDHGFLPTARPGPDLARREKTGSEKRAIARDILRDMDPDSPLLELAEELSPDVFAQEIDFMILENWYFDLWTRTQVLDRRMRSIVTIGQLIGLKDHDELRAHIPVALRNGVTVRELEELTYNAATYMGFPAGRAARATIGAGIKDAAG